MACTSSACLDAEASFHDWAVCDAVVLGVAWNHHQLRLQGKMGHDLRGREEERKTARCKHGFGSGDRGGGLTGVISQTEASSSGPPHSCVTLPVHAVVQRPGCRPPRLNDWPHWQSETGWVEKYLKGPPEALRQNAWQASWVSSTAEGPYSRGPPPIPMFLKHPM